jgi:cardiolipin synthase
MATPQPKSTLPGALFHVAEHELRVVHSPEDRLSAVLQLIGDAKKSIRMFFYMFGTDATGREVMDALVHAAERGVTVELVLDSFGSSDTAHSFFDPLVNAGAHYHFFGSRWGLGYLIRNHQKMLIIDDLHALVGGFNITDQYFGRKGDESWEDLGLIVSGAEAAHLGEYFDAMAMESRGGTVRFRRIRAIIREWKSGDGDVQWLLGGPTNRISPWGIALKRALESAKRLDIVSAYFSPSQTVLRRIAKVTRQKKGSRLVMAGKTDNGATIGAARVLYRYLLRRKAKIYEYQTRPLHMKLMVIDDAVYVGSANLDVRSLFINLEIMVRVADAGFAEHMREIIDSVVAESVEQTRLLLKQRDSFWSRFKSGFAYFLVNSVDYTIGRRIKFGLLSNK